MQGSVSMSGILSTKLIKARKAPLSWRLKNTLRYSFIKGWLAKHLVAPFANVWGVTTIMSELTIRARLIPESERNEVSELSRLVKQCQKHGVKNHPSYLDAIKKLAELDKLRQWIDYGVVSYRVVTDAGVAFLVDDWDNDATDITTMHFHGCGEGVGVEAVGDVALGTESTTDLNPDSTRATGTESQPAANQLRSVGTLTFDGAAAITEHGLFSQAATGGGTLWDRSVFAAINVVSGDSIQFTYTCTLTSGS